MANINLAKLTSEPTTKPVILNELKTVKKPEAAKVIPRTKEHLALFLIIG